MIINRLKALCFITFFMVIAVAPFDADGKELVLTPEECIERAIERNPAVLSSIERKTQAEWNKKVAYRDFFPMLSMDYSYTYLKDATVIDASFLSSEVSIREHDNYMMGLHIDQPLFTGFKIMESYNLAGLGLKEAEAGEQLAVLEIIYQTRAAYYDLLKAKQFQKVIDDEVSMLSSHLRDAQSFYDNEKIPLNSLLQSKVHLANAKQGARNAATMSSLSQNLLATIIKEPLSSPFAVLDEISTSPLAVDLSVVTAQALESRPELLQANYAMDASQKYISLAKSDYYPTVSLQATHNRYGGDASVDGTGTSDMQAPEESFVGVYSSWKLMDWGQRGYKVSQAKAASREAEQNLIKAMDNVVLDVKRNFDQATTTFANIEPAKLAVEQAKENFRMNEIRYRNQLATNTDVLDARQLLTETEFNYYAAIYDYHNWLAGLARAVGVKNWQELGGDSN